MFPHKLSEDLENYRSEIGKVLKPGKTCLITFFLINPESDALIQSGKSFQSFQHNISICRIVNQNMPESSTGHEEAYLRSLYGKYRLANGEPIQFGGRSGRKTFTSYQDIVCATKL